ncbi:cholinesterase [Drechmeria coniospora]|uniref:Carboxylic ester hydrolase n=1 Tax=Drechmeria coniospora TaxID=98403 RepID=A0A151GJD5_DRECN|nr:cholinesterase [Drechmeria coniospora]KYK57207.1 cholinesterase [Drechmeria coniospora]
MTKTRINRLFILLPSAVAVVSASYAVAPQAALVSGTITGKSTILRGANGAVNSFLGIPYAEKPQRFGLAVPPKPWKLPLNTSSFGSSCIQYIIKTDTGPGQDILDELFNSHPPESEDCLSINAFAPANPAPPEGRPVVVYIPGGGFQLGNGLIDLSGFAAYEDIVAFTFNYRTNIFGFPNTHDIPVSQRNLGLHDQRLALDWVQANAKAFGGDPGRVTIWGESAGAMSTDLRLLAYADIHPPPFQGAILSSGQMSFGLLSTARSAHDERAWNAVSARVGCSGSKDRLTCMRNVPAATLLKGLEESNQTFMPVADHFTVPGGRAMRWRQGRVSKVPTLMTTVAEEGLSLVNRNISIERFLQAYLPPPLATVRRQQRIVDYYRKKQGLVSDFDVAAAIYTDLVWQCPQQMLANASASVTNPPVWRGYFNVSIAELLPSKFRFLGKCHGADVLLLFATPTLESLPVSAPLYAFANYFRAVIGRFVRNPGGGPGWPAVGSSYAPFDVASLGDVGAEHTAGSTPVNRTTLDANCNLFRDILSAVPEVLHG